MANIYKLLLSLCLVAILPLFSHAKSSKNDTAYWEEQLRESNEYWKERTAIAQKANREAYVVDPYEVTANVSSIVSLQTKSGRRNMKEKKGGGCMATNPIDKCWMCDPNWEQNRKKLADCVIGFGKNTVGGKYGPIYVVTDSSDNELINLIPGTLRHAVTRTGPLWIIFAHDMVIRLSEELLMSSDKTIDGRGVDVHIANGAGITIQSAKNVIIHGIKIHNIFSGKGGMVRDSESHWGLRTRSDGDGISILDSSNIWIDHVTLKKSSDGLIDVISGSTAVTISNNFFAHQNKVMLFGANDFHTQDEIMQITVAFNRFGQKCVQRMPRCRRGFFHLVNNDYHHWEMYAIGGSMHPTIISEGNRFEAPFNIFAKEVTKRETTEDVWIKWQWRSTGDLFLNGAYFRESGPKFLNNAFFNKEMITAKHGVYVKMLTRTAGALECKPHKLCHAKIASEKQ